MSEFYEVTEEFPTLCCHLVFRVGDTLELSKQLSPNRLLVIRNQTEFHKVKRSTFNRCTRKLESL